MCNVNAYQEIKSYRLRERERDRGRDRDRDRERESERERKREKERERERERERKRERKKKRQTEIKYFSHTCNNCICQDKQTDTYRKKERDRILLVIIADQTMILRTIPFL